MLELLTPSFPTPPLPTRFGASEKNEHSVLNLVLQGGGPKQSLRSRASCLRILLAFKERTANLAIKIEASLGARACVHKTRRFWHVRC